MLVDRALRIVIHGDVQARPLDRLLIICTTLLDPSYGLTNLLHQIRSLHQPTTHLNLESGQ